MLLPKEGSGDAGVCVSMKTNKDKSQGLIIKSEVMIALCEDVSQMYHEATNVVNVCDQQRVRRGHWDAMPFN